jgi:hypothetical protein
MSMVYRGTPKGDIAYMRAPREAVGRAQERADPGLVVSPVYAEGAAASLVRLDRRQGFELLTDNAVNYSSMLQAGFDLVTGVVERCGIYRLTYSRLDDAVALVDRLHRESLAASGSPP